ncbi:MULTISPECIES: trimeric intracellular cation channel family protein [Streptomyces]|uniref:trimeric intracellular cation channel family protein n=1 Tax=Streptomyces TaxID=1883 RepID=UPI0004C9D871|nr:trimeric intracellular cation channel family protein [Streptomyces sp. NRRL S-1868]
MTTTAHLTDLLRALDLTGVFANAVLGGVIARAERFDLVGFVGLAILSGLGGGLIRDTLLQHGTPIALTDYTYLLTAVGGAALVFVLRVEGKLWDRLFPLLDALALGCWAAAGAQKTLALGLGWLPAVLLGVITAVGGGFVRDIVIRRAPRIFGGNTLYATCALVAGGVMAGLERAGHPMAGSISATFVGATLVLLARHRGWQLPTSPGWRPALRRRPPDEP